MIIRILTFLLLFIISIFITPLLTIPLAIWYTLHWYAPELILGAILIDIYFGTAHWPYYTIMALILIILAEISKRYLMLK